MRSTTAAAAAATITVGGAAAAIAVGSCVDTPTIEELAAQTVVVTQVEQGVSFDAYATFAIGDVIPTVRVPGADAEASGSVDPAIAAPTLDAIAAELTARGYRRVPLAERPDLGVAVTAVIRVRAEIYPYGAWWGFGAAEGGYCGYAGSPFVSGFAVTSPALWQSGALVIELYDLRLARVIADPSGAPSVAAPTAAAPIPVVWAAFVYGVLGGPDAAPPAPPIDGIRQAFAQSPTLRR